MEFLCGIGVFLFALQLINISIGNYKFQDKILINDNSFLSFFTGLFSSLIVQSSSAINSISVQLSSKGIISRKTGYYVALGTNIGTTITAYLVLINVGNLQYIIIGSLFFASFFLAINTSKCLKNIFFSICSFILIFVGLHIISGSSKSMVSLVDFSSLFLHNNIFLLCSAVIITAIIQSSSLMSVLIITFASAGIITIESGIFMVIGINIGTCSTAFLSCIGANKDGLAVSIFNLFYNILGMFLNLTLYYTGLYDFIIFSSLTVGLKIALFHTLFNVSTTLLFITLLVFDFQYPKLRKKTI